jgi:hypothetical protein
MLERLVMMSALTPRGLTIVSSVCFSSCCALLQVFEVLAQVPWLDEDDLKQKELKGVAMVGVHNE